MKKLGLLLAAALAAPVTNGQLIINELMQSNIDCIMDDINEFPDSWVELYNNSDSPVNLSEYSLGVKDKVSKAYKLPAKTVAPHGYVLIYCDKAGTGLHASFRLESGKDGGVYLFKNGDIADKIEKMKKQPDANIAYGRVTDGASEWGYQCEPTPGKSNVGKITDEILPAPVFSVAGQVLSSAITLSLSIPDSAPAGAVIRYTTDGAEPTEQSRVYSSSIRISSTTNVRAKLFCDGYLSPRSTTHSYIFFPREMTLPIVSVVTQHGYFYDSKLGIYVTGNYNTDTPNYEYDWRRPANIEFFESPGTEAVINQLGETRVKGGASRGNKLKSLVFYANKRFGTKRFTYEFFPDQRPGRDDFKSFEMRNAGNDFDGLYMRDAVIQRMMGQNADLDWQAWRPAILMVNGNYVGILNIRERSNEDNIYTNYDGLEDIDMFENWWELKSGDWDNYNAFRDFYAATGHSLDEFKEWMDVEEFANLMIMNIFYNNQDFPGNNIVMWRPKTEDGKWRWVAKDTDFGLGLYGSSARYKTLDWLYNPDYDSDRAWANQWEHTRLFRRLMDIDDFKSMFIDRMAVYMGDFMNARHTNELIDEMYDIIKDEYPSHRNGINPWWPNYDNELRAAKDWVASRTDFMPSHMAEFLSLGAVTPLTIGKKTEPSVAYTVNGISLRKEYFDGSFFAGRRLAVEGVASNDDAEIKGWKVRIVKSDGSISTSTYSTPALDIVMPTGRTVEIEPVMGDKSAIDSIVADESADKPVVIYDLSGRRVDTTDNLPAGIYIFKQGSIVEKRVVR